jgi:hypothetical protein
MSPCLIHFDRDIPSQLWDVVTLVGSSLYIRVATTEIATHKTPTHLGFAASTDAPPMLLHPVRRRASTIGRADLWNHAILHRERANKFFENRSSWLLARFVKFFTTAHLPLYRSRAEGHRLQRELSQANRRLHSVVIIKELQVTYDSCYQITSYIFNMLICVGMILIIHI